MRGAGLGLRLGVRRAGLHATRHRAGSHTPIPCTAGACRRCSTVGNAEPAASAAAAAVEWPWLKNSLTGATATALFEADFKDVATTLDVAPIRRPHVVGSLVCNVDDYPVSIALVENCDGTSVEAVTEAVQWCAVQCACAIRSAAQTSVRTFFLKHVCAARPRTMARLDALDMLLRLRLTLRGSNAAETSTAEAMSPAKWCCTAALLDPWESHPQLAPVACPGTASGEAAEGEAVGELQSVVERVMAAVDSELQRRLAQHTTELAQEARLFLSEAGSDADGAALTAHCLRGALQRRATAAHSGQAGCGASWGELRGQPTWLLRSAALLCADDADHPLAFRFSLQRVVRVRRRNEAGTLCSTAVALQAASVQRGLRELVDTRTEDGAMLLFDNALRAPFTTGLQSLTVSSLARILAEQKASWAEHRARGPLDLVDHVMRAAATLSPTIAHDWVGAARCGDVGTSAPALVDWARRFSGPGLPACVRWTTLVGRRQLNNFAADARSETKANTGAAGNAGPALPPVWPLLQCVRAGAGLRRRAYALRELLRLECGLRSLPQARVAASSSPALSLQYDAALCLTTGVPTPYAPAQPAAQDEVAVEVYRTSRYASVAAAAAAQTPWAAAAFLSAPTAPHGGNASSTSARLRTPPRGAVRVAVDVPSVTHRLRAMGVMAARWAGPGDRLDYTLQGGKRGPSFRDVATAEGYARLIRYGARPARYVTAQVPLGAAPVAVLRTLLKVMTEDDAEAKYASAGVSEDRDAVYLPLPLTGSAATLSAATDGQHEANVHALLSAVRACCREPSLLALVLPTAVEAADMVFVRYWPVVAPLLASRGGSLQARLRRVSANADAEGGGSSAGLELVLTATALAPASVRLDDAAGCMSAVYSAMRTALWRSRPELFATHGDAADAAAVAALPLLRLDTLADFAEALLFTSVVDASARCDLRVLARHLFSGNVTAREVGAVTDLWLDLGQDAPPLQLTLPPQPDVSASHTPSRRYGEALTQAVALQCATASPLYWAAAQLKRRLVAATCGHDGEGERHRMHVRLSCKWGPSPPAPTSLLPASPPPSWQLQFVAELCSGESSRPHELRNPHPARIGLALREVDEMPPAAVLQREAGPDGFAVLWRLLHGPVLGGGTRNDGLLPDTKTCYNFCRAVPAGFVSATLRSVARLHGVAEVRMRYSAARQQLVLEGWRAPRPTADAPAQDAAVTIASVPTPPRDVLAHLFRLPRRLLAGHTDGPPPAPSQVVVPFAAVALQPHEDVLQRLCDALEATPSDFETLEVRRDVGRWVACLAVPLRVLRLTVASSEPHRQAALPASGSSGFAYVYARHRLRRHAVRGPLLHLVVSVFYPYAAPSIEGLDVTVDFEPRPGLFRRPSTQPPAAVAQAAAATQPQARTLARPRKATRPRHSVVDLIHDHVAGAMGDLVNGTDGRVALRLSQTFGLTLVYTTRSGASAAALAPGTSPPQPIVVQLVREAWLPDMWAPEQVLAAELRVVQRIFARKGSAADAHGIVEGLLSPETAARLATLQCGPGVRAKAFCVSFFHRYFGWRVCERDDAASLPLARGHSSVVVMECEGSVRRASLDRAAGDVLAQSPRSAGALADAAVAATLQLVQIVPDGETATLRLGRVVADSKAESRAAALDGLWGPCVAHIAAAFDVSPGLSSEEADQRMARFMHACLDLPLPLP